MSLHSRSGLAKLAASTAAVLAGAPAYAKADYGNLFAGFVMLVLFAFALWVALSIWIAVKAAKRWMWRVVIAVVLTSIPYAIFTAINRHHWNQVEANVADSARLLTAATAYLETACRQERTLVSRGLVSAEDGLLLNPNFRNRIEARGGQRPPPPKDERTRDLYERQYEWGTDSVSAHLLDQVVGHSPFPFAESPFTGARVSGRLNWWREKGRSRLSPAGQAELEKAAALPGTSVWSTFAQVKSTPGYELTVDDVSTTEDRRHWVARVQLRLIDRRTAVVAAEYLGFLAHPDPGSWRTSRSWSEATPCPDKESDYKTPGEGWRASEFFFAEVVRYAEPAR